MAQQILIIEANREGYGIDQISETNTVGEMIAALERLEYDAQLYLSHDNGYTYGGITGWNMNVKYIVECPECGEEVILSEDDDDFECECGENLYDLAF